MNNKYNYYTPTGLAKELIQLLPHSFKPSSVGDICCGTWNLLRIAHDAFPNASIVGVDTDDNSSRGRIPFASFHKQDGRDFVAKMLEQNIRFDFLLSNPPFGALSKKQKKYSIDTECITLQNRYESELLYANYLLLNDNGILLIILPVTYAKGMMYKKYRIWIAQHFDVLQIVSLPVDAFGSKQLHTVALVLKKTSAPKDLPTQFLTATHHSKKWDIIKEHTSSRSEIASGNWFGEEVKSNRTITVYRGNISSHYFAESGTPILHCSSNVNHGKWEPSIRKCNGIKPAQEKYAESGDVLINRIGKHAASWSEYAGDKCLISDCLYVIKKPDEYVIQKLSQASINGVLQIPRLGVATPYITLGDIRQILL